MSLKSSQPSSVCVLRTALALFTAFLFPLHIWPQQSNTLISSNAPIAIPAPEASGSATSQPLNNVIDIAASCPTAHIYDETCWTAAVAAGKARSGTAGNFSLHSDCQTYTFSKPLTFDGLKNVEISGAGACSIITYNRPGPAGAVALTFNNAASLNFHDFALKSPVTPATVKIANLPASGPFTSTQYIAIDRGNGYPYVPTVNDFDVLTPANGGKCTTHCISPAQFAAAYDIGLYITHSSNVNISNVTGHYAHITFSDVSHVTVHDNHLVGGGKANSGGGIVFYNTNSEVNVSRNTVQQASYSGVWVVGTNGLTFSDNIVTGNGESGLKIAMPGHYVTNMHSSGNRSSFNSYDGLDFQEQYAVVKSTVVCNCTSTGDTAWSNRQTGMIANGAKFQISGLTVYKNGNTGLLTTLIDSVITGTVAYSNNASLSPSGVHQIVLNGDHTTLSGSTVTQPAGTPGSGIYLGTTTNTLMDNHVVGSQIWDSLGAGKTLQLRDTDSTGTINTSPGTPR